MTYSAYPVARRRRRWPWLVAAAVVVVALAIGAVVVARSTQPGPRPIAAAPMTEIEARPAEPSDAPAGLQGQQDPICEDHALVYSILAARWQSFAQISEKIPASDWTPEQRDIADATARAMLSAAAQYETMLPRAGNRVIKELLAQSIVYLRANAENLPKYRAAEDVNLAFTATRLDGGLDAICRAAGRVASVPSDAPRPTTVAVDPGALVPFMKEKDGICLDYMAWAAKRDEDLNTWELQGGKLDVPAAQWTPEQQAIAADVAGILARNADEVQAFAERAENPLVRDFLQTAVPYNRLFAERLPAYELDDGAVWDVTSYLINAIRFGCKT